MGVYSGRYCVASGHSAVRNWSVNEVSAPKPFVASNTKAGTGRKRGVGDWNGGMEAYGHTPVVMPGELFAFLGYTAPADGVIGHSGVTYGGNAIVDQLVANWNWEGGDILSYSLNFSGNGAFAESTGTYDDTSAPDVPSVLDGCKIMAQPKEGGALVEVENLTSATWTLTAANQTYVNSSTLGWTGRRPGVIDWTLALNVQNDSKSSIGLTKGSDYLLRLYVTAALYWELSWGHIQDFTNLKADRETGAILACTINVGMQAGGAAIGSIKKPGGSTFWP